MFAISIEASHAKGMGHLFRMLNFTEYLKGKGEEFIFFINDLSKTKEILTSRNYLFEVVDYQDLQSDWESSLIKKYDVKYWINDRLGTAELHAKSVLRNPLKLITFDDQGCGARLSDINICGLTQHKKIQGKKVLKGAEYLILNPEIETYRKKRKDIKNILVTLGGSDTHGVTVKILKILKKYAIRATIHIGPSFEHIKELKDELDEGYKLISNVPSLIEEFSKYDLAITGGGVTPFEANASGLPCLIVANEMHEIDNAKLLESLGSSRFIAYHEDIDEEIFKNLDTLDVEFMSEFALQNLDTLASEKIYREIKSL